MTEKRKGYKDQKDQIEANRRYLDRHPEQRKKNRVATLRSECKNFIKKNKLQKSKNRVTNYSSSILFAR